MTISTTRQCIFLRHGQRRHETGVQSGDGPLTLEGRETSLETARRLCRELSSRNIRRIDLAIVSVSVRCVETFAVVWGELCQAGIVIAENDIDISYFFTPEENILWGEFNTRQGETFREARKLLGEKEAMRLHALNLVRPCVERTLARVYKALDVGARTILICTHGPLDAFMAEELTKNPTDGLKQGYARIVSFQYPA
jgi:broad specificity phosphatase PhoE